MIKLYDVNSKAANILKQTFLSKGGEVAISRHCADLSKETSDVIIMATIYPVSYTHLDVYKRQHLSLQLVQVLSLIIIQR